MVILLLVLAAGCLKLSIICFYRRLFVVSVYRSPFNRISIAALVVAAAWMITFVIASTLSCGIQVAVKWGNLAEKNQYCGIDLDIDNALVISDAATNLLIWLMPMPMIWRLHLSWRRKLAIVGILMIGSMYVKPKLTTSRLLLTLIVLSLPPSSGLSYHSRSLAVD